MSRVPDNLETEPSPWETQSSNYGIARHMRMNVPSGLLTRGGTTSVSPSLMTGPSSGPGSNSLATGPAGQQSSGPFQGGGGSFQDYFDSINGPGVDDERLSRYFTDILGNAQTAADNGGQSFEDWMNSPMLEGGDFNQISDGMGANATIILELSRAGGGRRGFLDRAIQLSFDDPEKFTQLQMELVQHGFVTDQIAFGRAGDQATVAALQRLVEGKWQVGSDMTMVDYLQQAREGYLNTQFDGMDAALSEVDAAAADELRSLREAIDSIDLEVNLTDPAALEDSIQNEAVRTLGRRLSDGDMQEIIGQVHDRQRDEFWENNSEVKRYNELVSMWEDAATNSAERASQVISGTDVSDVDAFLAAISGQESGGDHTVVNSDSGAYGEFQFMPETWATITRRAGLNPNDRSKENQYKAARYMAAGYFEQFGNWRDAAIAWYAGAGGVGYSDYALNRKQVSGSNEYPSINEYADSIVQRMRNGSGQPAAEMPDDEKYVDLSTVHAADRKFYVNQIASTVASGTSAGLSDLELEQQTRPGGLTAYENVGFDMAAFLRDSVTEAGGVDADAFSFANRALSFYDLLGER